MNPHPRTIPAAAAARAADAIIKASGDPMPRSQAGHMTAPDRFARTRREIPGNAGAVHT